MEQAKSSYKNVILTEQVTTDLIDFVCNNYKQKTDTEIANELNLSSRQVVSGIKRVLYYYNHIERLNKKVIATKKSKVQQECDAEPFDNYQGEGKETARKLISDRVTSTNKANSNILTLPAKFWLMEKAILTKHKGAKFVAVEQNKKVHAKMMKNLVKDSDLLDSINETHNTTISSVIHRAMENTYTHAILDYCGVIDSYMEDLLYVMNNNLVQLGGFITVTVAKVNRTIGHKYHKENYSNKLIDLTSDGMTKMDSEFTNDFLIRHSIMNMNGRYKLDHKYTYKDNKRGYGMVLYIIQRIK